MIALSLGVDRAIGVASLVGLLGNYGHVDFDTNFSGGNVQSESFGLGVYAGSAITEHIVVDAMLIWSRGDNDVKEILPPPNTGSFDSERIQAAANMTGYWYRDAWRYSPTVGIVWSRENQDAYVLVPSMTPAPSATLESGVAIAGFQIGHTTTIDDVRTIEPWIGINAEWEFHTSGVSNVGISGLDLEPFDLRVLGGLNAQISEAVSANIRADVAGLARSDYLVATIGGQIAVRF
jgi:outer membrane autotransporter protein